MHPIEIAINAIYLFTKNGGDEFIIEKTTKDLGLAIANSFENLSEKSAMKEVLALYVGAETKLFADTDDISSQGILLVALGEIEKITSDEASLAKAYCMVCLTHIVESEAFDGDDLPLRREDYFTEVQKYTRIMNAFRRAVKPNDAVVSKDGFIPKDVYN